MMEFFLLSGQMSPDTEHGGEGQAGLTIILFLCQTGELQSSFVSV